MAKFEVSVQEKCLLDMPYEILFEIFRRLAKGKLIDISKLCSRFRDVAGDARLWKDVYIDYNSRKEWRSVVFAFEDLYSEPWPVKVIDLSYTEVNPPVSLQNDQVIKVEKLDLSFITSNKITKNAILAKYQYTELCLDADISKIDPKAFAKQTALKVLSIVGAMPGINHCLTSILKHCKNLKTLDMYGFLFDTDMLDFANHLPSSLEKLFVCPPTHKRLEDSFFRLLAEKTPNLRELKRLFPSSVKHRSLRKLQFLEALHVSANDLENSTMDLTRDLHTYLVKFPALRTFYLVYYQYLEDPETELETLRKSLQPHGVTVVGITRYPESPPYPKDGDLWNVSKPM